jgi:hypothetical protein
MSNQAEPDQQQPETVTSQEVREYLLAELEASQQAISELSDEQLEEVAGGAGVVQAYKALRQVGYGTFTSVKGALSGSRFERLINQALS